ncbi:nuclear receptor subfamily 6 group A member 1-like [Eumetopias jubatus]|uniref:nuclear receptor subfamily 6 group A member 1-like n=1 Tax=Eumetopias jubatus TaxID=34886 RepID=UPI001016CA49|nr:nuclear receptor subfamily 6 group A member 1-like [Eumetopias jubatus]
MERDERPPSGGGGGGGSAGFLEPPAALPPPPRNGFCQDELPELDPGTNEETDSLTLGQGHTAGNWQSWSLCDYRNNVLFIFFKIVV